MKINRVAFTFLFLFWIGSSCQQEKQQQQQQKINTPTGGSISIAVDETLKPLLEAEEKAFEGLYQQADIRMLYVSEAEAADLLVKDSVSLAILCRKLDEREEALIKEVKIYPTTTKVASDAVALILHKDNRDTLLSYEQLQAVLQGKIKTWQELDTLASSAQGDIQIVFDHEKSSTLRLLKERHGMAANQPHFFALENNQKVIDYVAQNPQAIGVIGLSWISDTDDPVARQSLNKIKVMGISGGQQQEFYQPYQAYIAQGVYPLIREVNVVSREARAGLGSGFTAFLANEKGQRIVLKSGLLPATMPIRLVQIAAEPVAQDK